MQSYKNMQSYKKSIAQQAKIDQQQTENKPAYKKLIQEKISKFSIFIDNLLENIDKKPFDNKCILLTQIFEILRIYLDLLDKIKFNTIDTQILEIIIKKILEMINEFQTVGKSTFYQLYTTNSNNSNSSNSLCEGKKYKKKKEELQAFWEKTKKEFLGTYQNCIPKSLISIVHEYISKLNFHKTINEENDNILKLFNKLLLSNENLKNFKLFYKNLQLKSYPRVYLSPNSSSPNSSNNEGEMCTSMGGGSKKKTKKSKKLKKK
jgi:hypothetical protein